MGSTSKNTSFSPLDFPYFSSPRFEDLDLELPSAAVSIVAVSGNAHGEGAKTSVPLLDIVAWWSGEGGGAGLRRPHIMGL